MGLRRHQVCAAIAAFGAGVIRDTFGAYTYAWWAGAALCAIAASPSLLARRPWVPGPECGTGPGTLAEEVVA
jgi:hypothetical protein